LAAFAALPALLLHGFGPRRRAVLQERARHRATAPRSVLVPVQAAIR